MVCPHRLGYVNHCGWACIKYVPRFHRIKRPNCILNDMARTIIATPIITTDTARHSEHPMPSPCLQREHRIARLAYAPI